MTAPIARDSRLRPHARVTTLRRIPRRSDRRLTGCTVVVACCHSGQTWREIVSGRKTMLTLIHPIQLQREPESIHRFC